MEDLISVFTENGIAVGLVVVLAIMLILGLRFAVEQHRRLGKRLSTVEDFNRDILLKIITRNNNIMVANKEVLLETLSLLRTMNSDDITRRRHDKLHGDVSGIHSVFEDETERIVRGK